MESFEKAKPLSLLLVDDDGELCSMMKEFFGQAGCRLECAYNGRDGLARALNGDYDLVLLDVMLPIVSGFTVLQQLRRRKEVPVIMLTARIHREDRIAGLDSGADDYLPKPFDPDELLARIRAVLRRSERLAGDGPVKVFGDILVNLQTREAWSGGQKAELTGMEFDILEMLIRAAGRVVSREEITATLLERQATPYDRALDVHISHLRGKLEHGRRLIRTVRGVGYVFTVEREGK
ncbi:MAG TPA: response regulator transcription factor [Candidatus Acidoferrales bacterium]|jgi:DNA-binding response OmpR family regulator|nr:response regulator transcription factor [Candidatus Acidoferrales bacterium]